MDSCIELPDRKMPESYNENDYKCFKSFMYINDVGRDVMCEVAQALYAKESGSESGTMPLGEYFDTVLKISNKKLNKFVSKMHKNYLLKNLQLVTFDIPFAHIVVMKNACPVLFPKLSETCRDSIERLNKLRDKTCHVYEYCVDIGELEDIFGKIYDGVSEVVGNRFSDSLNTAKNRLRAIFSSKVCQVDIDSYLEAVMKCREELICQLIEKGRIEIKECSSQLLINSPFMAWPLNQDGLIDIESAKFDIYSSLRVRDNKEEVDLEKLFKVTKRLGNTEDLPCALLLHGDAGYGKTTLCHHIIQEWCREDSSIDGLHDFELVVFVEVRRVLTKHLEDFLRERVFRETLEDFDPGSVVTALQNINVLFIIDGFDEARRESSLPLVKEILCKFKQKRIVLTTRNSHLKDATLIARNFRTSSLSIEVCGFDKEKQNLFITEMVKALNPNVGCQKEILELQNYKNGFQNALDSHLKAPIILCLFIHLWQENPTCFSRKLSVALLYSELSQFCKKRLKDCLDLEQIGNMESILNELQLCLGQQAWNMLVKGNLVCLTEEAHRMLTVECNKRMIDETKLLSSYLCHETGPVKIPSAENPIYAFLHKSHMEFFAAMYLADAVTKGDCSLSDIDKFVCKASDWCSYQEVAQFFAEHLMQLDSLNVKNVEILKEFVIILKKSDSLSTDFTFWWNIYLIVHESEEIRPLIRSALPKNHWCLDANHVVAGLELYWHLRVTLETLKINIPADVDPFSIEGFLAVMKKINKEKKSHSATVVSPAMVELHFWHHYEHGVLEGFQTSAEFIQLLHPWGYLASFVGKLGHKEVLKYSVKLKTICVRLGSVGDILSFTSSILKYYKNVKSLKVMLCLPYNCSPDRLPALPNVPELEIVMKDIEDAQLEWLEGVLQHVVDKCEYQQLTLLDSRVSYKGISRRCRSILNIVHEMTIKLAYTPSEEEKNHLLRLQSAESLQITWPD